MGCSVVCPECIPAVRASATLRKSDLFCAQVKRPFSDSLYCTRTCQLIQMVFSLRGKCSMMSPGRCDGARASVRSTLAEESDERQPLFVCSPQLYSHNLTCSSFNILCHASGSIVITLRTYRITFAHLETQHSISFGLWRETGNLWL